MVVEYYYVMVVCRGSRFIPHSGRCDYHGHYHSLQWHPQSRVQVRTVIIASTKTSGSPFPGAFTFGVAVRRFIKDLGILPGVQSRLRPIQSHIVSVALAGTKYSITGRLDDYNIYIYIYIYTYILSLSLSIYIYIYIYILYLSADNMTSTCCAQCRRLFEETRRMP